MHMAARRWTVRSGAALLAAATLGLSTAAPPGGAQEADPTPATTAEVTTTTSATTTTTPSTTTTSTVPAPPPTDPPPTDPSAPPTTTPSASPTTSTTTATTAEPDDPPPTAAAVSVTLDPARDLVDGTPVTITATGLAPGAWMRAAQCVAGVQDLYVDCDVNDSAYAEADGSGTATFTLRVDALFATGWPGFPDARTVDCRVAGSCSVAVATEDDGDVVEVPLPFAADAPLAPPPSLTVDPTEGLAHNQAVAVAASGLVWGQSAVVLQCPASPADASDCDSEIQTYLEVDSASSATATVNVSAVIDTAGGTVDCRTAGACVLAVTQDGLRFPEKSATRSITFDPDTEVTPPTLTVTPDADLVDGQAVTVAGSDFPAGWVSVYQCPAAPTYDNCLWTDSYADVTATGTFETSVEVRAVIPTADGEIDCRTATQPCQLIATANSLTSIRAGRAELHFDPEGPVAPGPTITVTPTGDLPGEATVTIAGSRFEEGSYAEIGVCEVGSPGRCDAQADAQAPVDNTGAFTTELGVAATFETWDGDSVDCRAAPGCEVAARSGYQGRRATAALSFGPSEPAEDRYLEPVFDEVEITRDVVFRHTTDAAGAPVALALDVYEPAGDDAAERPVVVWMHGGWFSSSDRDEMAGYAEAFARRGYVAVTMAYRSRPGLRCCPTDDVEGVTAAVADATDDAAAGVQWLRDHADEYRMDPAAIAAGGHEGGAAAAFGLAHTGDVAAALPIAGVDLRHAEGDAAPFLAFHDRDDRTAPPHISEWACTRTRAAGTPCGTVSYGLGWSGELATARQRDIVRRSGDFLAEVVLDPLGYVDWTGPTTPTGPPGSPGGGGDPGGGPGAGTGDGPSAALTPTLRVGAAMATVAASTPVRSALPRTGAELARLVAVAAGLAVVGGTCLMARRRRTASAGDTGAVRLGAAAAAAVVVLLLAGFVVTGALSPTSSSDDEAAEDHSDHSGHGTDGRDDTDGHGDSGHTGSTHRSDHRDHDDAGHDSPRHDEPGHDDPGHDDPGHRDPAHGDGAHATPGHGHQSATPASHAHGGGTGQGHAPGPGHPAPGPGHPGPGHPGPGHPHEPEQPHEPEHPHEPEQPHEPGQPDDGFDPDWSPDQTAYARALVDDTETQLARYANPAVLPLLGYQWIRDGQAPGEYQHWIHLSRIVDQRRLDPAFPESLVFRNATDGPVLEAAMYMLSLSYTMDNIPADIAWLPGWHIHDNLCFVGNYELVGVTVDGQCERGSVLPTPPMLHVWAVETRCGRFAGVDEHGLQCHHEH